VPTFTKDFPLFRTYPDLIYLDSAATSLISDEVLEVQKNWYKHFQAPLHRSVYHVAVQATEQYEAVREQVRAFIQAPTASEIIFTHSATEGMNLVAHIEQQRLQKGDEIIISRAEHHSALLPWQRVAQKTGAKIIWLPAHEQGYFPYQALEKALSVRTQLVVVTHISNVLGYIAPLSKISKLTRAANVRLVVDAAQSIPTTAFNVQAVPVDYAVFSGHKMYGPEGTGFVYARAEFIKDSEPFLVGGGSIAEVTTEKTIWASVPHRFEAGSGNSAGIIGLGAAITYLQKKCLNVIQEKLAKLTTYTLPKLQQIPGLTLYGPAEGESRAPIFSFSVTVKNKTIHSHDICHIADQENVALRGGHHCAQPLMAALGVYDLTRASGGIYTSKKDIDHLVKVLWTSIVNIF